MNPDPKPFIIPIFIPHAGCPHRCVFCDQHRTTGTTATLPADNEIEHAIDQFLGFRKDPGRHTEIAFFGGNFLGLMPEDIRRLLGIAAAYVHNGKAHGIRFSTRPDTIDAPRLAVLAEYPVATIEIGVQSMDDGVLRSNGRDHSAEDTRRAAALIRRHTNYRLGLQMMIGMVGDSFETALITAEHICALSPDFVRIYPLLVLKDSPLEDWHVSGHYRPLTLTEAVDQTKVLYNLFLFHGIAVIRMGLQPGEELNSGAGVVAGPFHPAFGELVRAAVWRDTLEALISGHEPLMGHIDIRVHPSKLSQAKGQKNANLAYLSQRFGPIAIDISGDDALAVETVAINNRHHVIHKGNRHE